MEGLNIDNLKARFEGMAAALLNIEVNTIVKQGMSAQKMPEVPIALHQVAKAYASFLAHLPEDWKALISGGFYDEDTSTNGPETFTGLASAASDVLAGLGPLAGADEREAVLVRIRTNSRQIRHQLAVLQGPLNKYNPRLIGGTLEEVIDALASLSAPLPIPPDITVLIRKVWDVGTEIVVLQSTLQIDGDAVTRMSPAIFEEEADGGLATDGQRAFLSAIHHEALATATAQWKTLFQVLGDLMGSLARVVFPRV